MPVPVKPAVCGLDGASSAMFRLADFTPALVGENFTRTMHVWPGLTLAPRQVLVVVWNSPGSDPPNNTLETMTGALPMLERVNC